jgi:hypothetical protein
MTRSFSRRQLLVLDCCFSGAIVAGIKATQADSIELANAFQSARGIARPNAPRNDGYGRVIITACDAVSYAMENSAVPNSHNSLFTHFLLQGLRGSAADAKGRIWIDELYDYAYERILDVAPKQTPHKAGNQQGNLLIAERLFSSPKGETRRVTFAEHDHRPRWYTHNAFLGTSAFVLCVALAGTIRRERIVAIVRSNIAVEPARTARVDATSAAVPNRAPAHAAVSVGESADTNLVATARTRSTDAGPAKTAPTPIQQGSAGATTWCYRRTGYDPTATEDRTECDQLSSLIACRNHRLDALVAGSIWTQATECAPCTCSSR